MPIPAPPKGGHALRPPVICVSIAGHQLPVDPVYRNFAIINDSSMDMTMAVPVSFTAGALAEIKRLMSAPDFDTTKFLRVGVKGGGCSGLSYILGFDDKQPDDEVFEFDAQTFIMNKSHGIYLMGMQIDWANGLNARGFTFINPNASKTCGCGTSFAV
jgi:iron-sulfur cluster assembly accessory protein